MLAGRAAFYLPEFPLASCTPERLRRHLINQLARPWIDFPSILQVHFLFLGTDSSLAPRRGRRG